MANRWTILKRFRAIEIACSVGLFGVFFALVSISGLERFGLLAPVGFLVVALLGAGTVLAWQNRWKRRLRATDFSACLYCMHDLRGIGERGVCPECGREFELSETRDAWRKALAPRVD